MAYVGLNLSSGLTVSRVQNATINAYRMIDFLAAHIPATHRLLWDGNQTTYLEPIVATRPLANV